MAKKKWLSALIIIALVQQVVAQGRFTIEGKFSNLDNGTKIMLSYKDVDTPVEDSTIVKDGTFVIKGKISSPCRAILQINSVSTGAEKNERPMVEGEGMAANALMKGDAQEFFLDKGTTRVSGTNSIKTATVRGGKEQANYLSLESKLNALQKKMDPLSKKMMEYFREKNTAASKSLFPQLHAIRTEMVETQKRFVKNHPDSYLSLDLVASSMTNDLSYEQLYRILSDKMKNTPIGKRLAKQIVISNETAVGHPAIDFTQNDTQGNPVSLASLRGKYVLLDFWASWCTFCREENPYILKAYHQFKDKNLRIVGISLDSQKEPWLKAIKQDRLPWIELSDLQGWKNKVAMVYRINALPQNFLIDPTGKIVAKDLRGNELIKKLEEILGKDEAESGHEMHSHPASPPSGS